MYIHKDMRIRGSRKMHSQIHMDDCTRMTKKYVYVCMCVSASSPPPTPPPPGCHSLTNKRTKDLFLVIPALHRMERSRQEGGGIQKILYNMKTKVKNIKTTVKFCLHSMERSRREGGGNQKGKTKGYPPGARPGAGREVKMGPRRRGVKKHMHTQRQRETTRERQRERDNERETTSERDNERERQRERETTRERDNERERFSVRRTN